MSHCVVGDNEKATIHWIVALVMLVLLFSTDNTLIHTVPKEADGSGDGIDDAGGHKMFVTQHLSA